MAASVLLLDDPLPGVRRLTLNRPEKRTTAWTSPSTRRAGPGNGRGTWW